MSTVRHLLKIGLTANVFDFYEVAIFLYLADIIGQLFFNTADTVQGLIKVFEVFVVGKLARLLGSLFFGLIGDRIGRGLSLKISLMMTAVPTALIGLLPTYHEIGLLAPALLLTLQFIESFGISGELQVNACYIFEAAPAHYKSVLCGVVMASEKLAILLATLTIFLLFLAFDRQTILTWAWRLPFLFSIPLTIMISVTRRMIHNLPAPRQSYSDAAHSTLQALKGPLFRAVPIASFSIIFFYTLIIWLPSYLIHFLHYPSHLVRLANTVTLCAFIPFILAAGYIAGFVGYQQLTKVGIAATIVLIYPLWLGLQQGSWGALLTIQLLLAALLASVDGVLLEMLARQFPSFVRCRGMNVAFVFPAVLLGSTTPLIYTLMIEKTGWLMFPAFYLICFGLLALPAALGLETHAVPETLGQAE